MILAEHITFPLKTPALQWFLHFHYQEEFFR